MSVSEISNEMIGTRDGDIFLACCVLCVNTGSIGLVSIIYCFGPRSLNRRCMCVFPQYARSCQLLSRVYESTTSYLQVAFPWWHGENVSWKVESNCPRSVPYHVSIFCRAVSCRGFTECSDWDLPIPRQ